VASVFRSERGEAGADRRFGLTLLIAAALALAAVSLAERAQACSQCMCGTPFPAGVLGGVVPKQVTYGLEERYLSKTSGLDEGPGEERESENRVAGFMLWRPLNRLALLGRLPYNIKQVTDLVGPAGPNTQTSRGVGDAELTLLAGIVRRAGRHAMTLGLVLGGTAPTGSNDARDADGQRLDIHLQPGIGAWSGTAGLNLAMNGAHGTWDASVLNRVSGTSTHGYRYGKAVLYNAGFTSHTWKGVQLLAQINGRWAARDRLEDGTVGENTGGLVTYATPGMRWLIGSGLGLEGAIQVPVSQRLYGDQTEHATGRVFLSMST
jgi:hypothetical protein